MGVGFAVDLVVCSALGVDMYDCVFPSRTAVSILKTLYKIFSKDFLIKLFVGESIFYFDGFILFYIFRDLDVR